MRFGPTNFNGSELDTGGGVAEYLSMARPTQYALNVLIAIERRMRCSRVEPQLARPSVSGPEPRFSGAVCAVAVLSHAKIRTREAIRQLPP